ncbi:MAG: hypothetical protein HY275_11870 [Gemmatimonadetes bacterium]|nr:hypothetical protein [Gemmatimonadota bacterium]
MMTSAGLFDAFMGSRIGAKRLLGLQATRESIRMRLAQYSVPVALEMIGRISCLTRNGARDPLGTQLRVCEGLGDAGMNWRIQKGISRAIAEDGLSPSKDNPRYNMFSSRSLCMAAQMAATDCATEGMNESTDWTGLLEALLMVNDLIDESERSPSRRSPEEGSEQEAWVHFVSFESVESGGRPMVQLVARAAQLYLTTDASLMTDPDFIDLRALFLEATGLTLDAYALALLTVAGPFLGISEENAHSASALIHKGAFQGPTLAFSDEEVNSFFRLGGLTLDEFVPLCREEQVKSDFGVPLRQLAVESSPLVSFGSFAIVLSLPLLEQRLTSGLYHVLLNARRDAASKGFRDKLLRFLGRVFEGYVGNCLLRLSRPQRDAKPRRGSGRKSSFQRIVAEELRRAVRDRPVTPSLCDFVLVRGTTVVLVECKAKLLPLDARTGASLSSFSAKLEEILVDAAAQLHATYVLMQQGAFAGLLPPLSQVREVIPVVVWLQDFTMNPFLRRWIRDRLLERGLLQADGIVSEMEVLDCSDISWMETASEFAQLPAIDALRARRSDPRSLDVSMLTWGYVRYPRAQGNTEHDTALFDEISEMGLEYFRAHQRGVQTRHPEPAA